jgi:hypothetical protein
MPCVILTRQAVQPDCGLYPMQFPQGNLSSQFGVNALWNSHRESDRLPCNKSTRLGSHKNAHLPPKSVTALRCSLNLWRVFGPNPSHLFPSFPPSPQTKAIKDHDMVGSRTRVYPILAVCIPCAFASQLGSVTPSSVWATAKPHLSPSNLFLPPFSRCIPLARTESGVLND